jgi:hypothetical protein
VSNASGGPRYAPLSRSARRASPLRKPDEESAFPPVEDDQPEVLSMRAYRYEPLDHITGNHDLGSLWAEGHCVAIAETRSFAKPGEQRWLVRSPWPGLTVGDVVNALWNFLPNDYNSRLNPSVRDPLVRQFFSLDADEVQLLSRDEDEPET